MSKSLAVVHCPICAGAMARAQVVLCQTCAVPHHQNCWRYNRGCGVYGCTTRTFSRPLGTSNERVEFVHRRQISQTALLGLGGAYILALFLFLPFVPTAQAEMFFAGLSLLFTGSVLALGAPTLVRVRYRIDPGTGAVARTLWLGPVTLRHEPKWLPFEEVARLEIRRTRQARYYRNETGSSVELGLRTTTGAYLPLAPAGWEIFDQLQEKAEGAAELLGTTVLVPLALAPTSRLSAGMLAGLLRLPSGDEAPVSKPEASENEGRTDTRAPEPKAYPQ